MGIIFNTYICITNNKDQQRCPKYLDSTVFLSFFYSKEHEPLHVHVEGNGGMAKYDLIGNQFVLRNVFNIKKNDLKRIEVVIDDNKDIIIKMRENYFGKEAQNEN